jgi:hypothetical protein
MRVFVNAAPIDVDAGATALDCVRRWSQEEGAAVVAGRRLVTDSRGLPVAIDSRASAGSIYRTVANRESTTPDD